MSSIGKLKKMGLLEFIRRMKKRIDEHQDCKFIFFLGAGCSVTSGIPAAGGLTRLWLQRHYDLQTGRNEKYDIWLKRSYPDYSDEQAPQFYNKVIEMAFSNDDERQLEIERLAEAADPGFGYAVLAKLMIEKDCGHHCNIVITTNFDDLVADALYLYTRRKPLMIVHESLARFVRSGRTRPLVVKIHGDAHLAPKTTAKKTKRLPKNAKKAAYDLMKDSGIIFIGYGGMDESITNLFQELPKGYLPGGIFWINEVLPGSEKEGPENHKALGKWLKKRKDAVWVKHSNFDELMLLMWKEFGLTHPDKRRFKTLMDSYYGTFEKLSKKIDQKPETAVKQALSEAVRKVIADAPDYRGVYLEAKKYHYSDPDKADRVYEIGMQKFPNSASLICLYAEFLSRIRKNHDQAENLYKKAIELEPETGWIVALYANFLDAVRKNYKHAESLYKRAVELEPEGGWILAYYAVFLEVVRKNYDQAESLYKKAVELEPEIGWIAAYYAIFLETVRKNYDQAESLYKKAVELDPETGWIVAYYAHFMERIRKNHRYAEELYAKALKAEPESGSVLKGYAGFLLANGNEDGFSYLDRAIQILTGDHLHDASFIQCLFYRYAHTKDAKLRHESLGQIKTSLEEKMRSYSWDLSPNVERAIADGHPEPEFLKVLAKVISDEVDRKELDKFEVWRKLEESK